MGSEPQQQDIPHFWLRVYKIHQPGLVEQYHSWVNLLYNLVEPRNGSVVSLL